MGRNGIGRGRGGMIGLGECGNNHMETGLEIGAGGPCGDGGDSMGRL